MRTLFLSICFLFCLSASAQKNFQPRVEITNSLSTGGGGGGGPTLVASDNFDSYADASALSAAANWDVAGGPDGAVIRNVAGDGSVYNSGVNDLYYYSGASFNSDQRAEGTIDATGGAFEWVGLTVRVQAGAQTGYWLMFSATELYLYSFNAGTPTLINSDSGMSFSAGHKIALEAAGAGTATRLKVQIDTGSGWVDKWTNQNPADDIDNGKPGVGGGSTGVIGARIDDWKGYNL